MRTALALVGLLGCAVVAMAWWRHEAHHARELAEFRAQLADLKRTVGDTPQAAPERPWVTPPNPPGLAAHAPEEPTVVDDALVAQPSVAEWTAHIAEAFVSESVDISWARKTERALERSLGELLPEGSSLRSVSCRTSLCRVETEHANEAAFDEFQEEAIVGPRAVWRGALYATRAIAADGNGVIALYLAREGHEAALAFAGH